MGERLYRFAQAHVIGENATEMVAPQELEPAEAVLLVRAEIGIESLRCRQRLDTACCFEVIQECAQFGSAGAQGRTVQVACQLYDAARMAPRE